MVKGKLKQRGYKRDVYRLCKSLLSPVLENVPKWMYRNGTYIMSVQCTEVVHLYMYRRGRTEVVRMHHVPTWLCTELVLPRLKG